MIENNNSVKRNDILNEANVSPLFTTRPMQQKQRAWTNGDTYLIISNRNVKLSILKIITFSNIWIISFDIFLIIF